MWQAVQWSAGAAASGAAVVAGLVGVLARYTGQEEVVLGLASGGVLRVEVAGDPGFGDLIGRVAAALAAPLSVTAAGPAGPVVVGLADGPVAEVGPGVVDTGLVVWMAGDGSALRVDFAVEEFSDGWVRGLLDAVVTVVTAGSGEPDRGLSGLALVSAAERDRLLGWGRGPVRDVPTTPIHELVVGWAQRSPEAMAGVAGGEVLTYGELVRRSGLVAGFLRSAGVGVGDVVSLALDRSLWTLVAALGVLRAGAAYTPMDVAWPAERMRVLLADHGARVVLTVGEVAPRVPCPDGVRVVALDDQWPQIEAAEAGDLPTVT
ncbi:AMP-binding protein, partial [Micromonospora haikouensis]|uniref:AMP-binding protein n=1 Tax=Micromonospora haikouensis TaxID=686309 RepID=UPI0037BE1565